MSISDSDDDRCNTFQSEFPASNSDPRNNDGSGDDTSITFEEEKFLDYPDPSPSDYESNESNVEQLLDQSDGHEFRFVDAASKKWTFPVLGFTYKVKNLRIHLDER